MSDSTVSERFPRTIALHKVLDSFTYGISNYPPERLRLLLSLLAVKGYVQSSPIKASNDSNYRRIALTFDDGYQHLVGIIPELVYRFQVRPIIFMPTACIGRSNAWDYSHLFRSVPHLDKSSIQSLASIGVEFGSHSHNHVDLTRLPVNRIEYELKSSRDILQEITNRPVTTISYPFGRCNSDVIRVATDCGYIAGFGMQPIDSASSMLNLGRIPLYSFESALVSAKKIASGSVPVFHRAVSALSGFLSVGTDKINRWRRFEYQRNESSEKGKSKNVASGED